MIAQLTLIFLFAMFLLACLRVVSEYQRLAIFRLGRYFRLKGPGLISIMPITDRCFRISIGDKGQLISDGVGKFKETEVPVEYNEKIYRGSQIKVSGFLNQKIQVILDIDQRRVIKCEKCGHEMRF